MPEAERVGCKQHQQKFQEKCKQEIHDNFIQQPEWFDNDTLMLCEEHKVFDGERFVKRSQAEVAIKRGEISYTQKFYELSKASTNLLRSLGLVQTAYQSCYGNQLQHVFHKECIDLLERAAQLQQTSPIFVYQSALVYCIDAAQIYNKSGLTHNASVVADFCWTFLDYGKAVLEGVRDGVIGAAQYAVEHPAHTVASAVAGEYMLTYQLGKIVYSVLNLAVATVVNPRTSTKNLGWIYI